MVALQKRKIFAVRQKQKRPLSSRNITYTILGKANLRYETFGNDENFGEFWQPV